MYWEQLSHVTENRQPCHQILKPSAITLKLQYTCTYMPHITLYLRALYHKLKGKYFYYQPLVYIICYQLSMCISHYSAGTNIYYKSHILSSSSKFGRERAHALLVVGYGWRYAVQCSQPGAAAQAQWRCTHLSTRNPPWHMLRGPPMTTHFAEQTHCLALALMRPNAANRLGLVMLCTDSSHLDAVAQRSYYVPTALDGERNEAKYYTAPSKL